MLLIDALAFWSSPSSPGGEDQCQCEHVCLVDVHLFMLGGLACISLGNAYWPNLIHEQLVAFSLNTRICRDSGEIARGGIFTSPGTRSWPGLRASSPMPMPMGSLAAQPAMRARQKGHVQSLSFAANVNQRPTPLRGQLTACST